MKRFILILALLLFALPAHAIKVVNLDEVPHTLFVNNGGEISEITIQPGSFYNTYGPTVSFAKSRNGSFQHADYYADYAIWPGGKLVLQNRRDHTNR